MLHFVVSEGVLAPESLDLPLFAVRIFEDRHSHGPVFVSFVFEGHEPILDPPVICLAFLLALLVVLRIGLLVLARVFRHAEVGLLDRPEGCLDQLQKLAF